MSQQKPIPVEFSIKFESANKAIEAGDIARADRLFEECAAICPEAWLGLASETQRAGDLQGATKLYMQTLKHATAPITKAVALNNLGGLLQNLGLEEESEDCYRRSWEIHKTADSANNIGLICQHSAKPMEAIKWYEEAMRLNPRLKQIYLNRSMTYLLIGDYPKGFREYESRWEAGTTYKRLPVFRPEWKGEDLNGKRIMVYHEQGAGDVIMIARFFKWLKARGATVLASVHSGLSRLVNSCGYADEVYEDLHLRIERGNCPPWDYQIPAMSLLRILGVTVNNCSQPAYLSAPDQDKFRLKDGLNIGIAWAGYVHHGADKRRSSSLQDWLPLFDLKGINWYSLQVGARSLDLAGGEYPIEDLSPELKDFADTAEAISKMDLVIGVDTSPIHVAGAIGAKAWLLCAYAPDWRWMLGRADSIWYPSIRIFRQPKPGDWASVFVEIKELLELHLALDPSCA